MKIIQKPDRRVVSIIGSQSIEEGLNYCLSPYAIKDDDILFNSLTGEAVLTNDLNNPLLIRRWFLIPEKFDAASLVHLIHQKQLGLLNGPGSQLKDTYTIFTTTACNASCSYCFEKGYDITTMTDETAEDVFKFIMNTKCKRPIAINWFGGEPLYNRKPIDIITSKLNERNVNYRSRFSTNGDLLNDVTDDDLKRWRASKMQFSLDDVDGGYDKIKGLPSGAYSRLIKNAERLSNLGIIVTLRIHVNPKKLDIAKKLFDDFKHIKKLNIYGTLIYGESSIEDYNKLLDFNEYYGKRKTSFMNPWVSKNCMADKRTISCITPEGKLTICEHYPYGENVYGSIYSDQVKTDILRKWSIREKQTDTKCKECPLYPHCSKLINCPAEGKCSDGYQYYQIETIKRALRKKVEEFGYQNN